MDLIADIGATYSRCALLDGQGRAQAPETFRNADFTGVAEVLGAYLHQRRTTDHPRRAALAVAAPIIADRVQMTNIDWQFSQEALQKQFEFKRLIVVNDFGAVAWALPDLSAHDRVAIGGGSPAAQAALAALGPGSGLGVATLIPALDTWAIASGEGGHVTMPAATEEEAAAIELIRRQYGHCSAERVLSGPGLVNLYVALAQIVGRGTPTVTPHDVTALARQREPLAQRTLDMFFAMLGTVAANLALTVGARGGVFIAGGIVPALLDPLRRSTFRERFEQYGRYSDYLRAIPTYVITAELPALLGLRRLLGYR